MDEEIHRIPVIIKPVKGALKVSQNIPDSKTQKMVYVHQLHLDGLPEYTLIGDRVKR